MLPIFVEETSRIMKYSIVFDCIIEDDILCRSYHWYDSWLSGFNLHQKTFNKFLHVFSNKHNKPFSL